jgi:hypothetical protein
MTERRPAAPISDEDVMELLPWFAAGTTTPDETKAIEQRLASSPTLQAELALVRREKQVWDERTEALGQPDPQLFDRVLAQLDGVRQFAPIARDDRYSARSGLLARLSGLLPTPAVRLAMAAACLVIVVEAAAIVHFAGSAGGTYQTASAPDPAASGPRLIVQFQANAPLAAAGSLLADLGATIVRGPMPGGAYVIALQPGADVDAALTALRGHGDLVASVDRGS